MLTTLAAAEPSSPTAIDDAPVRWHQRCLDLLSARRAGSLALHSLLAVPVALLPSVALLGSAYAVAGAFGIDVSSLQPPDRELSIERFFSSVVFAPVVETLLLGGLLWLLCRMSRLPLLVAAASGVLWGALHGAFGFMWFFGTCWSFYVMSCCYLAWRPVGWWKAFVAAAAPHAVINLTALSLLFLAR